MKPIVTVQVGANVPVGCKNHVIYAESPETQKCVNVIDGECPYWRKEKISFGRGGASTFCPMAGLNEDALVKKNFKTRPTQLGFFLIPQSFRQAMGLSDRPTEITNIVLMSHSLEVINDPSSGRVVSVFEPVEAIEQYPILEYNLMWWKKTELVCKGDGETAHWYPASPDNKNHMRARKCLYRECNDFQTKGQCKEVGEFFFRVKNSPGFPAMWKFQTRSRKAIEYILNELRDIHSTLGHVSLIPLKLTLEKEKGHPFIERMDQNTGQMIKTRLETEVYRVHIRTEFTMMGAIGAKKEALAFLMAGTGDEVRQLREAVPDVAPDSEPPVEMNATASPADYQDDESEPVLEGQKGNVAPVAPPAAKPAPAAPAPAKPAPPAAAKPAPAAPAAPPPTAAPKKEEKKTPDKKAKPKLNLTPEQTKVKFMELQEKMAAELVNAQSSDELRQIVAQYNPSFDEIGRRPNVNDEETYVIKLYREHMEFFKKQNPGAPAAPAAPAKAAAPAPKAAAPAAPAAPAPPSRELTPRQHLENWMKETPPVFPNELLEEVIGKSDISTMDDDEVQRLYDMAREAGLR